MVCVHTQVARLAGRDGGPTSAYAACDRGRCAAYALERADALRKAALEDASTLEAARRAPALLRRCYAGAAAAEDETPPPAPRNVSAPKAWLPLGEALLAARAKIETDVRGPGSRDEGVASRDHVWPPMLDVGSYTGRG